MLNPGTLVIHRKNKPIMKQWATSTSTRSERAVNEWVWPMKIDRTRHGYNPFWHGHWGLTPCFCHFKVVKVANGVGIPMGCSFNGTAHAVTDAIMSAIKMSPLSLWCDPISENKTHTGYPEGMCVPSITPDRNGGEVNMQKTSLRYVIQTQQTSLQTGFTGSGRECTMAQILHYY